VQTIGQEPLQEAVRAGGANNIGYFGPHDLTLRSRSGAVEAH
jgi:hypothetical protein